MGNGPTRLTLLMAALMLAPTFAAAETCPGPFQETFQGSLWWGESTTFAVNLLPCQTVSFTISTSSNPLGAALDFKLFTNSAVELLSETWLSYGSADQHSVPSTPLWIAPYRGTRGTEGLPVTGRLHASAMGWQVYSYTIVMTKQPRQGYNQGGTSFSNALPIVTGVTQYGSIHEDEPGQFYKIHLESGQSVFLDGEATGSSQYGSGFLVHLYDANQQLIATMVYRLAYGTVPLTPQGANPTVYTNPGGPGDFYLQVLAQVWPIHDFHFVVRSSDTVPCGFTVTPSSVTWPADGGTGNFSITASSPTCQWAAVSQAVWLTPGTTTVHSGSGDDSYQVGFNDIGAPRTGGISIAGFTFTVTQTAQVGGTPTNGPPAGSLCPYTLSTRSFWVSSRGSVDAISVFTAPGCAWSAMSNASWLHLSSEADTGPAQLLVSTDPLPSGSSPRDATVSIAGVSLTVHQVYDIGLPDPATTDDVDRDGLPDSLEEALARTFMPTVWWYFGGVSGQDDCIGPGYPKPVVFRARPLVASDDGVVYHDFVAINYVFLYDQDCGALGHAGDAESFVVVVGRDSSGGWQKRFVSAIAHHNTANEMRTFPWAEVYISRNKHAFYASVQQCDNSPAYDHCGGSGLQIVSTPDGMGTLWYQLVNAGEPWQFLNNDLGPIHSTWAGQQIWSALGFLGGDAVIAEELPLSSFLAPFPSDDGTGYGGYAFPTPSGMGVWLDWSP
jgi:hypothetical protein